MRWRRKQRERDLEHELRSDLELEAQEQQENGASPDEARYAARRSLGNVTRTKEATREMWGWTAFERLGQDLRYGIRTLARNPGFSLAAIFTLALGIGANTAMFSLIDGVLLRPLPYPEADRIALVHVRFYPQNAEYGTMSIADYLDWKGQNHAFDDPALFTNGGWRFDLINAGEPLEVQGCAVTENFFSVLRVSPLFGRVFHLGETGPAVVLSERLWRNRFGANPDAVGKTVTLNGIQTIVIGVMPLSFAFPAGQELWTNIRLQPPTRRGPFPFVGIARIKPGTNLAQAQAETNAIARQIERASPGSYHQMSMPVLPLREAVTGKARPALLVMFGAVFLVLLIATANVASLMLVRSSGRERLSLGAMRGRLIRQLLTESVLLGCCGGFAGLAIAWIGVGALRSWNPGNLPRMEDVHLDLRVLAFTFLVSIAAGIVFGLAPAFRSAKADLNSALKQGGRSGTANAAKRRTQSLLVVGEIALSFMLLIAGGLLLRSFVQLERADAGFQAAPDQVLTMRVAPSRKNKLYPRILQQVQSLPGVVSVALSDSLPPDRRSDYDTFQIEGQPWTESGFPAVTEVIVSPDYFRTLRIPLRSGRYFTNADEGERAGAIIISESLARRYFQSGNAIGQHIAPSSPNNHNRWLPVVGVIADVKYTGLDARSEPAFYRLYSEFSDSDSMRLNLVVRSTIAENLMRAIEQRIRAIDPNVTLSDQGTLETVRFASVAQPRFRTLLIAGFAGAALLLAAIGIYGVIGYSVSQRTNEIGLRMALGAQRGTVLKQIVGNGAVLSLIGMAIGCAGSLLLNRVLSGLLFATNSTDPVTFASVTLILAAVAIVASLIPAVRATRIDPSVALRCD